MMMGLVINSDAAENQYSYCKKPIGDAISSTLSIFENTFWRGEKIVVRSHKEIQYVHYSQFTQRS